MVLSLNSMMDIRANSISSGTRITVSTFLGNDVEGWLFELSQYFDQNRVPIEQRLMIATLSITGEAFKWFQPMYVNRQIRDLMIFERQILARFGSSIYCEFVENQSVVKKPTAAEDCTSDEGEVVNEHISVEVHQEVIRTEKLSDSALISLSLIVDYSKDFEVSNLIPSYGAWNIIEYCTPVVCEKALMVVSQLLADNLRLQSSRLLAEVMVLYFIYEILKMIQWVIKPPPMPPDIILDIISIYDGTFSELYCISMTPGSENWELFSSLLFSGCVHEIDIKIVMWFRCKVTQLIMFLKSHMKDLIQNSLRKDVLARLLVVDDSVCLDIMKEI